MTQADNKLYIVLSLFIVIINLEQLEQVEFRRGIINNVHATLAVHIAVHDLPINATYLVMMMTYTHTKL